MFRPATSNRGNEKFVEWKEPVQSKRDIANVDGHDCTSRQSKKKQATRHKFMLSSFGVSIQRQGIEEQGHPTSPTAIMTETRCGTLSPSRVEVHSLATPPIFKPPRRMQSTRSSILLPISTISKGASGQTPDMLLEANNHQNISMIQQHMETREL